MCLAKTFVYDCGHKHLIRLHCTRNNPLLCHDLTNKPERRYYDCCCCIEYQLSVAEKERREREREVERWRGVRDESAGAGDEDKNGEGHGNGNEREEKARVREWLNSVQGDCDMANLEEARERNGGEPVQDQNHKHIHDNGTSTNTARTASRSMLDADGDIDMLTNEAVEFQDPNDWSCAKVIQKPREGERKEGEDEDYEVWEGMDGGPF
ncbi:hypothetical protein ONS95_009185 [Cadophora gregata]|uniref:uncharacterized protein n=1 Tax=Cadophora gregata TaxID=51156 RepID=UPI0026DB86B5|nr:uncharacterized protein ONS95_009185 [Cadophora gregata]KAK0124205.1 hypothetical protein ONS95_009185 [Cadophora gregata]KAK0129941.1 hypothetical protein ONS96_000483 [Cadophora gregata f. sp. sojae]